MYASDYPHSECQFPNSVDNIPEVEEPQADARRKSCGTTRPGFYQTHLRAGRHAADHGWAVGLYCNDPRAHARLLRQRPRLTISDEDLDRGISSSAPAEASITSWRSSARQEPE